MAAYKLAFTIGVPDLETYDRTEKLQELVEDIQALLIDRGFTLKTDIEVIRSKAMLLRGNVRRVDK